MQPRKPLFRKKLNAGLAKYATASRDLKKIGPQEQDLREELLASNMRRTVNRQINRKLLHLAAEDFFHENRKFANEAKGEAAKVIDVETRKRAGKVMGLIRLAHAGKEARARLKRIKSLKK